MKKVLTVLRSKVFITSCAVGAVMASNPAFATLVDNDGNIDYSSVATSLKSGAMSAISAALAVGIAIYCVRLAWKFFKSFAK